MGFERRIVPDFEVIVCAPEESFRWNVHDYPHHLAKWHYHPEFELHLIQASAGEMMIGDYVGAFEAGSLVLTGSGVPHNWVSRIQPGERVPNRDMLIQFSPDFAEKVAGLCPEFDAVGELFEDAKRGIEFSGATAEAGRRLLRSIGAARGAQRLLMFLELMTVLARNPAERRTLSRAAPSPDQLHPGAFRAADPPHPTLGALRHGGDGLLALLQEADGAHLRPLRELHARACGVQPARQFRHADHRYLLRGRLQQHRQFQPAIRQDLRPIPLGLSSRRPPDRHDDAHRGACRSAPLTRLVLCR